LNTKTKAYQSHLGCRITKVYLLGLINEFNKKKKKNKNKKIKPFFILKFFY